jgi:hypothetical protein
MVVRQFPGLDVLHAQFALFVRSSVPVEGESLVVMSEAKMFAHAALVGAPLFAQRDRAFHHVVVLVPSDVEMSWPSSCR